MSQYEITQTQFTAVTGLTNPSYFSGVANGPVEQVNWYHALVFCNKLSMAEKLTPVYTISGSTNPADWGTVPTSANGTWDAVTANWSANGYRLPTEMEWMWAAMGATSGSGYTGGTYTVGYQKEFAGDPNPTASGDPIGNYAWYSVNAGSTTHTVGTTTYSNELGLYDMSGNVWEWCWDWYADNGTWPNYAITGPVTNYTGAASGAYRVLRGGSWGDYASLASVAYRGYYYPNNQNYYIGFRVVRP